MSERVDVVHDGDLPQRHLVKDAHGVSPVASETPAGIAADRFAIRCNYLEPAAFCRASLIASIASSMTVVGTKLGGNERGGNSLKVAVN